MGHAFPTDHADLLTLGRFLAPVLGEVPEPGDLGHESWWPESWWRGPRVWWGGPLDVEGLGLGSVGALIAALRALSAARGLGDAPAGSGPATSSALVSASFGSIGHLRVDGAPPDVWAPLSGFHETGDGWVRVHANYPHHAERLLAALGLATAEGFCAALRERTALEVERDVQAARGVAGAVRSPEDWEASPMGSAAASRPWIDFTLDDGAPRPASESVPLATAEQPLAGVRVLDFTRVIAGPSATRLLGALGADVLRIDPPQLPELLDQHIDTDFAKRSALADLRDPEQLAQVRELMRDADVVFLGYRTSGLERFGLDPLSLRADFPHLVVVSLNAWGREGPWADVRGFDSIVQATSGIAQVYGAEHDGGWRPGVLPVQALDHATGMGMAAAAVALLAAGERGVTGSAHLSLATTAAQLLQSGPAQSRPTQSRPAGPTPDAPAVLEVPRRQAQSAYGLLDFVPPPLRVAGQQLEYPHPPELYGTADLRWRTR
ncbi:CoA transferase [Sinomonas terrae]|uniref:CoA transferase n=1 Tax=Sinomonas terrae TaxID=2908838 RepID=A0ABS9TXP5_9MICC|nr:CoA transferase [Sinomonas terrae]MCH6469130.1 CoA transferase [Sinomonas terrae]